MFELKCLKCGAKRTYTQGGLDDMMCETVDKEGNDIVVTIYNDDEVFLTDGFSVECTCGNKIEECR